MQIKNPMRYHLTIIRIVITKKTRNSKCWWGVKKKEPLCTVGGKGYWCSHCGKQYGGSSKKIKIDLPYDLTIPLWGVYLKKARTLTLKTCAPMFIAALSTRAKIWKQPQCSWMDGRMDYENVVYTHTYTIEYNSAIERRESWHLWQHEWTLRTICYMSQAEVDRLRMISLICGIYNKTCPSLHRKGTDWWLPDAGFGGWAQWVKEIRRHKLLLIK